jgi:hypothetical protein
MLPDRLPIRVIGLLLAFLALAPLGRAQEVSEEYKLKAAFVFRFAQFVDWPAAALDGRRTVEYCVWSPNPFGPVLQELVTGETLAGRPLAVREVNSPDQISTCHVLFVRGNGPGSSVLDKIGQQPILTVGESPRFLDEGGIIQLIRADNRIRFNINLAAANQAGLRLSSHLLRLAAAVRGGGA